MDHVPMNAEATTAMESHLPLVRALARSYFTANRTYVQLDDLIEAGRSGLLQAFCRFNEERGVQFGTYATWWVKKEMLSWIRQERHPVQIPDHVYKAVLKTSKVAKRLGETFGYAPSLEEIAAKRAGGNTSTCGACGKALSGRTVEAMNVFFHVDCFKCHGCGKPLVKTCINVKDKPHCDACGRNALARK